VSRQQRQTIITRLTDLNMWRRSAERAPHKPFLLLTILARLSRGEPLRPPQADEYLPDREFIAWHGREVFRGPERP